MDYRQIRMFQNNQSPHGGVNNIQENVLSALKMNCRVRIWPISGSIGCYFHTKETPFLSEC